MSRSRLIRRTGTRSLAQNAPSFWSTTKSKRWHPQKSLRSKNQSFPYAVTTTDWKHSRYEEASLRAALAGDGDYRHCFSPTCNAGQLHTGGADEPIFRCGACGHKHCVACEANWHEDETCTQYQDRRRVERGVENDQSQQEVEKLSKPCPKCKVPIEKNNGCDHMTCQYLLLALLLLDTDTCLRLKMPPPLLLDLLGWISANIRSRKPPTRGRLHTLSRASIRWRARSSKTQSRRSETMTKFIHRPHSLEGRVGFKS